MNNQSVLKIIALFSIALQGAPLSASLPLEPDFKTFNKVPLSVINEVDSENENEEEKIEYVDATLTCPLKKQQWMEEIEIYKKPIIAKPHNTPVKEKVLVLDEKDTVETIIDKIFGDNLLKSDETGEWTPPSPFSTKTLEPDQHNENCSDKKKKNDKEDNEKDKKEDEELTSLRNQLIKNLAERAKKEGDSKQCPWPPSNKLYLPVDSWCK